ncbi:MAG: endonuclease domain-containing protein [Candidatus Doudnabacteria bacterium]|nr:endonuclease domain-containing protein [Candidatus Doudnabacteria bacterium]
MTKHTVVARQLRNNMTDAEKMLWYFLRFKNLNSYKFRRQQPIGKYVVDFVCFQNKLIIEIDGGQHVENKQQDMIRDRWLEKQGFKVLRFWNNEVLENRDEVVVKIASFCKR